MQDADGGFYFLVYPINEQYENVLPENGEPQVVWPKNTSVSAASTAALAEAGSSPAMKKYYPAAGRRLPGRRRDGLELPPGRHRQVRRREVPETHLLLATTGRTTTSTPGRPPPCMPQPATASYQTQLFSLFPNPADPSTFRWGWWSMAEGWGNAIRDYAFAASSGRLPAVRPRTPRTSAACEDQIVAAGDDVVQWAADSAYGTPFPTATKAVLGGGWYFSLDQASDMAVAYLVSPKPGPPERPGERHELRGRHQPGQCHLPHGPRPEAPAQQGLPVRRQLPPPAPALRHPAGPGHGRVRIPAIPTGPSCRNCPIPTDSGTNNTYPYYDRWSDAYNVTQEFITVNQARSFMATRAPRRPRPRARPGRGPPRPRPSPCRARRPR